MSFSRLIVLLPCYGLEDLELHRPDEEAEQLLSAWSALWHPALVAAARIAPSWASADQAPFDPAGQLIVVPPCCENRLPGDWLARAEGAGAVLVRHVARRGELVETLLDRLAEQSGNPLPEIDADLVGDFLALGFCHLIVELLTRQLRYMSNLDEPAFQSKLIAAAEQAAAARRDEAVGSIQAAFRLLEQSREYFYPVESHLLDLTLVAPTTLGSALRNELGGRLPVNLLLSGELVDRIAREQPDLIELIRRGVEEQRVSIVGGEYAETELPLMSPEAVADELRRGLAAYERHLGFRPTVFARRRFGLSPMLPQVLRRLGFTGALHFTLDDGRFPAGNQSRICWEGFGSASIEAVGRVPFDAARAEAFLRLPERLGNSMDLDHVATVILAHWPGQSSPWYDDLRRVARYSSVLGKFSTVEEYFRQTNYSGQRVEPAADEYRSPYLQQEVAAGKPDAISRWVRHWRRQTSAAAASALTTAAALIAGSDPAPELGQPDAHGEPSDHAVADRTVTAAGRDATAGQDATAPRNELAAYRRAVSAAARSLGSAPAPEATGGYLVLNPASFPRRVLVEADALAVLPAVAPPVRAAAESGATKQVVVEAPGMGFAWFGPEDERGGANAGSRAGGGRGKARKLASWLGRPKPQPPLAEDNVLRNEFVHIALDPATGALRSIADYRTRGPRLAQQIAMRLAASRRGDDDPGADRYYSIMAADEIAVISAGPLVGEVLARGRLVDREGGTLARFRQTTRLRRGSRVIELEIELDVERAPEGDPWNSYYASRLAWSDQSAELWRGAPMVNCPCELTRFESPLWVDLRGAKTRTTLLCGGLPYHRRLGVQRLDTLLVVAGETARRFRLGIGIDVDRPAPDALDLTLGQTVVAGTSRPAANVGWLFHLDTRAVVATGWEPIVEQCRAVGARVRLLETEGRAIRVGLRCFRAPHSARKLAAADNPPEPLVVEHDRVTVPLAPRQWAEIELRFESP